jgi:hypothetical protein
VTTVLVPEQPSPAHRLEWRLATPGKRCVSGAQKRCGRPALLELNRGMNRRGGRVDAWWPYCEEHTYGRVLLADGIYYADEPEPEVLAALVGDEAAP